MPPLPPPPHTGQDNGQGRVEKRGAKRKGKKEGRHSRLLQAKLQILGDVSGGEMRVDMDAGRGGGRTSFSRTRLFACRHRCVCVLFRGPGERGTEGEGREGRRRDRQRAGSGRGERRAARASSRSFHGNFYQIFTIIPSGLDSAVRRHGEKERKRETEPSYTTGEL